MIDRGESPVRLAVIGAGLIGKRHIEHVLSQDCSALVAIVDPADAARALAAEKDVAWYSDLATLILSDRPDGVIIATPNRMHVDNGMEAIAAGLPALIEKPLADDVADAARLVQAADEAAVPLLTGHHRRHNRLVQEAKAAIDVGRLGKLVSVHGMCWFSKPAEYFTAEWRTRKGAGPVFLNLIHDIDLLRYLCGEIVEVQAFESSALRGYEVEETAVILLRFENGVLGTVNVSDTISGPWSWELTSGENPVYSQTKENCYMIGGTLGSLTLPYLDIWRHPSGPDWMTPIRRERLAVERPDPLGLQVRNFCEVIRGKAAPVVSGAEGLQTLRVIAAVKQAAATRRLVTI